MNEESAVIETILSKRKKWVEANRENDFEEGIQRLLTDLYPDTAHFIFELLQNAEDAGATKVKFDLKKDMLTFSHNGKRLFNNKDVEAITGIGDSPKRNDITQIGKFGIGFKAVFAYTETPRIYSGSFSFEIKDMVCPHPAENNYGNNSETVFEFPFNHKKKQAKDAFKETDDGLTSLKENVLLFLNNIETIEWDIDGKGNGYIARLAHSNSHFEVEYKNHKGKTCNTHWLRINKQIDPNSKIKNVAVAYKLDFREDLKGINLFDHGKPLSKQMQIIPIDGQLSIFFPAEKETTKLKFHIHGPFSAAIARDSIPHNNNDNKELLQQIASLLAESLHNIKKIGLLLVDFLAVLPNDSDELSDFYKPIQTSVIKEMKTTPLVPTHSKEYAPAQILYHGPSAIREVVSDKDLQLLIDSKSILWSAGVMQNSRQEKYLRTLGIQEWSWKNLISSVNDNFTTEDNKKWLFNKTDEWMQRFYILLKKAVDETDSSLSHYCKIVRVQSGEHISGSEAFFPDEENKKDKSSDLFPRVKSEILKGKRKQGVRQFLESIGVKEVGKEEALKYILNTYYSSSENTKEVTDKQHIVHMKKFVSFWKNQKEEAEDLFSEYDILYDQSKDSFHSAKELYIDMPYLKTGLKDYFNNTKNNHFIKYELWRGYNKEKIKDFEDFTHSLGVMNGLEILEAKATSTQKTIFSGRSGKINRDFTINGLVFYCPSLSYLSFNNCDSSFYIGSLNLSEKNIFLSKLIWMVMCKASPNVLEAIYTKNIDTSFIVKQLRDASWIPDKDGKFRKPSSMTKSNLHKDFTYDDRNGWLTAIGFGEDEKKKTEEYKSLKTLIKKFGVSEKYIDLLGTISQLPKEQQDETIKEFQHHIQKTKNKPSFPENEKASADSMRRASKVKERYANASNKTYEVKDRSVRTSYNEIRPEVKTYLINLYTNENNKMICQVCEYEMPFKLDGGSYYFEAVECIKIFSKECSENYLALCPVCAAKYKHAKGTDETALRSEITNADSLKISVKLAQENKTIRFVKVHMDDLKIVLNGS